MKKSYIILLLFISLFIFNACKDDEKGGKPSDISNVSAEAKEGAIMLTWDKPEDNNFLYIAVEFINPRTGELVKKNVSSFANSLLIDNLLKKDGEYSFSLASVSDDGARGNKQEISCTSLRKPAVITEYSEKLYFEVDDLSANASDPSEGNLASLIDGNLGSFYHTNWHTTIPYPHWIQFDLSSPVEAIKYISWNRKGYSKGNATEVSILGSNNGVDWEEMGRVSGDVLPSGGGAKYESPIFSIEGKTFTKIRYNAIKGSGSNTWINIAELELHKAWSVVEDPEAE